MTLVEDIAEMSRGGMTSAQIAQEIGRSVTTVNKYLRAQGIEPSRPGPKSPVDELTETDLDNIVALYTMSDTPGAKICREYGISYTALYRILLDRGVQPRRLQEPTMEARRARLNHAVELYERGVKVYKIEVETGIPAPQLYTELTRRKVQLRRER